jgi:hypothetical protein
MHRGMLDSVVTEILLHAKKRKPNISTWFPASRAPASRERWCFFEGFSRSTSEK